MSQVPSTVLEGGAPAAATRRRGGIRMPDAGLTSTANAPGVAVSPGADGVSLANQLATVLGVVQKSANLAEGVQQKKAYEDAQRRELIAQTESYNAQYEREIRSVELGDGAIAGATDLPEIQDKIATGKLARLPGVSAPDQAVEVAKQLIATRRADKGMTDAQAEGYYERVLAPISSALTQRDSEVITQARQDTAVRAATAATMAKTPEELQSAYMAVKATGVSDAVAGSTTYLAALKAAADAGDGARFEMVSAAMPSGMFAPEIAAARLDLLKSQDQQQGKRYESARDTIGSILYNAERGVPGHSFASARSTLEEMRPGLRGDQADSMLQTINSREEEAARATMKATKDLEENQIVGSAVGQVFAAGNSGTLAFNMLAVRGLDVQTPSGATVKRTGEQLVRLATDQAFENIATEEIAAGQKGGLGNRQIAQNIIGRQALWAGKNGVQPDTWQSVLSAGYSGASDANVLQQGKDGTLNIPPAVIAGVELYRNLEAASPQNLHSMIRDPRQRDFYDAVSVAMSLPEIGSPEAAPTPEAQQQRLALALTTASKVVFNQAGRAPSSTAIDEQVRTLASRGWFRDDAANTGDLYQRVQSAARVYAAMGVSPTVAVERAAKNVQNDNVFINGYYVGLRGVPISDTAKSQLPAIADRLIGRYVAAEPNSGLTASDLTLAHDTRTGLWRVTIKGAGISAPSSGATEGAVYFTPAGLEAEARAIGKEADAAIIARQNARNAPRPIKLPSGRKRPGEM